MTREIISQQQVNAGLARTQQPNTYKDRLVKLIPSEIIAAYLTIYGIIKGVQDGQDHSMLLWIIIAILFVFTPIYLVKFMNVTKPMQIIFTSIGFLVWVMVSGWPDAKILQYPAEFIGSIVLVLYTLLIPMIYKG